MEESSERENFEWREATKDEVDTILTRERPQSIFVHNLIKGSFKWSRTCPEIKTMLYCPKKQQYQGSVIEIIKGPVNVVAIYSPHRDNTFFLSALKGNGIVEWGNGPMVFCGLPEDQCESFERSLRSLGIPIQDSYVFNRYWLSEGKAREFEISVPEDVRIAKLDQSHATTVNSVWPYASEESLRLVTDMINVNRTAGLFLGKDSKLISWILHTYYGLGMLYTVEEYRRKGFGELIVKALSKALGNEGTEVTLLVRINNTSANSMFTRLGFKNLGLLKIFQVGRNVAKN